LTFPIGKHIGNIFVEGALESQSVVANFATTPKEWGAVANNSKLFWLRNPGGDKSWRSIDMVALVL
jgi:hypothetical protein